MKVTAHLTSGGSFDLDLDAAGLRRWQAAVRDRKPSVLSGPRWPAPGAVRSGDIVIRTSTIAAIVPH